MYISIYSTNKYISNEEIYNDQTRMSRNNQKSNETKYATKHENAETKNRNKTKKHDNIKNSTSGEKKDMRVEFFESYTRTRSRKRQFYGSEKMNEKKLQEINVHHFPVFCRFVPVPTGSLIAATTDIRPSTTSSSNYSFKTSINEP